MDFRFFIVVLSVLVMSLLGANCMRLNMICSQKIYTILHLLSPDWMYNDSIRITHLPTAIYNKWFYKSHLKLFPLELCITQWESTQTNKTLRLWIYENHICELWSEELFEGRSSQLYTQLMQLRKESLKKNSGLYGIRTLHLFFSRLHKLHITAMISLQIVLRSWPYNYGEMT